MSDLQNLHNALRLITEIRGRTGKLLQGVSDGMTVDHGDELKEKKFVTQMKGLLDSVNSQVG